MPLMSISIPGPSVSWYRVLPKPPALLHDAFPRRNSSLLQHHITSDKSFESVSDDIAGRRMTVPSIAYSEVPSSGPRIDSPIRNSIVSIGSSYTDDAPMSRKRTVSLMEDSSHLRDPSPHREEVSNQFCLCQPDPKIPRPRNGTCSCPLSICVSGAHRMRHL
jgi:HMG box factor, other